MALLGGGLGLALICVARRAAAASTTRCCRSSCCRRATSLIGRRAAAACSGLLAGALPALGGDAAADHRRAEEELTCCAGSVRPSPSRRSASGRFRSGSARRSSRSSASPASSSCSCRCCRSARASRPRCRARDRPNRALVMRNGADSEMTSGLAGPETDIIKQAPGMRADGNRPVASAELLRRSSICNKRSTGTPANVPMRGIEPASLQVRDEVKIVEGRMFAVRHERGDRRPRGAAAVRGRRSRARPTRPASSR